MAIRYCTGGIPRKEWSVERAEEGDLRVEEEATRKDEGGCEGTEGQVRRYTDEVVDVGLYIHV